MDAQKCLEIIKEIFDRNKFVTTCGIVIDEVSCGEALLHMKIDGDIHVNPAGVVHGGAFSTLANTAVGVACCTVGAMTVTQNITNTFFDNVKAGRTVYCHAKIINRGRKTITLIADVTSDGGRLLDKVLCTMYVKGSLEEIPAKW